MQTLEHSCVVASSTMDVAPPSEHSGDGLVVSRRDVLYGNATKTKSPAEIDLDKAMEGDPRGQADQGRGDS